DLHRPRQARPGRRHRPDPGRPPSFRGVAARPAGQHVRPRRRTQGTGGAARGPRGGRGEARLPQAAAQGRDHRARGGARGGGARRGARGDAQGPRAPRHRLGGVRGRGRGPRHSPQPPPHRGGADDPQPRARRGRRGVPGVPGRGVPHRAQPSARRRLREHRERPPDRVAGAARGPPRRGRLRRGRLRGV
ncbi:MAG: Hemerythrin domain protein, partial [uncultured Nocardioides sp.]